MLSWYLVENLGTNPSLKRQVNKCGTGNLPSRQVVGRKRSSYRLFSKLKNSSRVFALDLMAPSMQLVVVDEAVFCTPRITMHK
jgi:hypothetical protein